MRMICVMVIALVIAASCGVSYADEEGSKILKEGVLGAGSGAVGGLASGAKGKDLWKGALAGAGVNVVGGMLLDNMTGEKVANADNVNKLNSQSAYKQGYEDGFENGYKQGYATAMKEAATKQP